MNYYYLVASLPMLSLGRAPTMDEAVFLTLCREHLIPADQSAAVSLLLYGGEGCDHPFVKAWLESETCLRNAVARVRADRRGVEVAPYLRHEEKFDATMLRAVDEAFGRATPGERELDLDRFRWQTIEALAGLNPFALSAVLAYGLKLKLAQRWARLSVEAGRQRLEEMVTNAAAASR